MKKRNLLLLLPALLFVNMANARLKIPYGHSDKLEIVATLPKNAEYELEEGSGKHLDVARLHQEFQIAWIPAWITESPKLVLAMEGSDSYYELLDREMDQILKFNNLDKDELLQLGFYRTYGGKLIFALIIGFIVYRIFAKSESNEVKPKRV